MVYQSGPVYFNSFQHNVDNDMLKEYILHQMYVDNHCPVSVLLNDL